jgi:hypothetical protein
MDFLNHRERGVVFYQVFLYSVLNCRNCKRLREFEEIEISRHSWRGVLVLIARRKTLKTFVLIRNSASDFVHRVDAKPSAFRDKMIITCFLYTIVQYICSKEVQSPCSVELELELKRACHTQGLSSNVQLQAIVNCSCI